MLPDHLYTLLYHIAAPLLPMADPAGCSQRFGPKVLLIIAIIFLLSVVSGPRIKNINFLTVPITVGQVNGSIVFGTLGYCLNNVSLNATINNNATNLTNPTNATNADTCSGISPLYGLGS